MPSPPTLSVYVLVTLIAVSGAIGGAISAIWEYLKVCIRRLSSSDHDAAVGTTPKEKAYRNVWLIVGSSLVGIPGAFGVILLGVWLGRVTFEHTPENIVVLIALCVVSGFFSRRFIPILGRRIEDEILKRRIEQSASDAEAATIASADTFWLSSAMVEAQTALLSQGSSADLRTANVQRAIETISEVEPRFPTHRILHIYLGRLHRRLGEYDEAIRVLRRFIKYLHDNPAEAEDPDAIEIDAADAYYNISCYLALKAQHAAEQLGLEDDAVAAICDEAMAAFRKAAAGNPENLALARDDGDFDFIRDRLRPLTGGEADPDGEAGED